MPITPIATRIPQPSVPFVTADGGVSREWLYYLVAILNRTGGDVGISSAAIQTTVVSLSVTQAMDGDVEPRPPGIMMSIDNMMSDEAPRPSISPGVLLGLTFADDVPRAAINPFLISLLVADAA